MIGQKKHALINSSSFLTSKDGLINTQGGGLDGNNSDVSGDFVTNCGNNRAAKIKINSY